MQLVRDVMKYNASAVPQETSLLEAAQIMRLRNTQVLPVGDSGQVIGIITDRDIALGVAAGKLDPTQTPVGVVMEETVVTVADDRDLIEAANIMQFYHEHRLIVLDRDTKAMMGVITMDDIVESADPDDLKQDIIGGVPPDPDNSC